MLKSYFFIPANRTDFIVKHKEIDADFLIFDFEESVPDAEKESVLDAFPTLEITPNMYARTILPKGKTGRIDLSYMSSLMSFGFTKFVLPKVTSVGDVQMIADYVTGLNAHFEFILLVENPMCLLNLNDILKSHRLNITGLALGSHDYVASLGMTHNLKNLFFARQFILNAAKAYGLTSIDIVSMEIDAGKDFEDECIDGLSIGYDAKFFLHPNQLNKLHTMKFYSDEEIAEARKVYSEIRELETGKFSVIKLAGRLYEKPHLMRIKKIVEWDKRYGNK